MLDENLPTYRFQPSSDNPLHTLLYFTHRGSDPVADYLLKRPAPASSRNQYALGLLDVHYSSVIYGEVLLLPQWSQPTLSAAEVRAQGGSGAAAAAPVPLTPDSFSISLYNPDQVVVVKLLQGTWGKSDSWEFEIPEHTFKQPSTSRIDQDSGESQVPELVPKVVFRWKRDGRLSKDMICFMSGRSVGGKKNKEPDITVAMSRGAKNDSAVAIYEPNMARVDVEDRKGLEVVLLLSAEVIRDLYLSPRQDPFNTAGGAAPTKVNGRTNNSPPPAAGPGVPAMSGAISDTPPPPSSAAGTRKQADDDAEARRIQQMVAREEQQAREQRDAEEQQRIKRMLEDEETERRMRDAEINKETERLRKEYGYSGGSDQTTQDATPGPRLPNRPRPGQNQFPPPPPQQGGGLYPQQSHGGWFGPPAAQYTLPARPMSAEPSPGSRPGQGSRPPFGAPPSQPPPGKKQGGLGNIFSRSDEDKRKKMKKKRSVHF